MNIKPILFSTPMIQALLAGRKTLTRRIVKWPNVPEWHDEDYDPSILTRKQGGEWWPEFKHYNAAAGKDHSGPLPCPYGKPGDILWVRESWADTGAYPIYKANGAKYWINEDYDDTNELIKWKPSIHMPKAAARIWLQVVSIRVERVQDISESDAINEGVLNLSDIWVHEHFPEYAKAWQAWTKRRGMMSEPEKHPLGPSPSQRFKALIESINGPDVWDKWTWVIEFKILSTTGKPSTLNTGDPVNKSYARQSKD